MTYDIYQFMFMVLSLVHFDIILLILLILTPFMIVMSKTRKKKIRKNIKLCTKFNFCYCNL